MMPDASTPRAGRVLAEVTVAAGARRRWSVRIAAVHTDPPGRRAVLTSADDAVAAIPDGATVGLGGAVTAGHPMTLVRALARSGVRDLTLVAVTGGIEVDLLIACGCVSRVAGAYVGVESVAGVGPVFRRAVEAGEVEVDRPRRGALRDGSPRRGARAAVPPLARWRRNGPHRRQPVARRLRRPDPRRAADRRARARARRGADLRRDRGRLRQRAGRRHRRDGPAARQRRRARDRAERPDRAAPRRSARSPSAPGTGPTRPSCTRRSGPIRTRTPG